MIGDMFYWLVNMSVAATVAGTVVWLIGTVHRIPSRVIYWLWIIPLIRFLVPIGVNSRFSLMSVLSELAHADVVKTVPLYHQAISSANYMQLAEDYFPIVYTENVLEDVFFVGAIVWIIGTAILLFAVLFTYRLAMKAVADAAPIGDDLYLCDRISSPAVYGIVRPKIVLPHRYDEADMALILRHEKVHIRRWDNVWRLLAVVTACIHWFNPASWLFLKSFLSRMELSCDEAVLKDSDEREKAAYAKALLNTAQSRPLVSSPFGGAKLRLRIERILSYKRLSVAAAVASAILIAATGYMLLTNAM